MAFVRVARLPELAAESVIEVSVGEDQYALCNTGGEITALSGVCLHAGGPVGQGRVREGYVVCPWHLWGFDCRTGVSDFDPGRKLATYPVKLEGGDILIDLP